MSKMVSKIAAHLRKKGQSVQGGHRSTDSLPRGGRCLFSLSSARACALQDVIKAELRPIAIVRAPLNVIGPKANAISELLRLRSFLKRLHSRHTVSRLHTFRWMWKHRLYLIKQLTIEILC